MRSIVTQLIISLFIGFVVLSIAVVIYPPISCSFYNKILEPLFGPEYNCQPELSQNEKEIISYHLKNVDTIGSTVWLSENLSIPHKNFVYFDHDPKTWKEFGLFYSQKSAREACNLLGDNWELPSIDDYRNLVSNCNASLNDLLMGKCGIRLHLNDLLMGKCGIRLHLKGEQYPIFERLERGEFLRQNEQGFYWTSTRKDDRGLAKYIAFVISKISGESGEIQFETSYYPEAKFPCRCIRKI